MTNELVMIILICLLVGFDFLGRSLCVNTSSMVFLLHFFKTKIPRQNNIYFYIIQDSTPVLLGINTDVIFD